MILKTILFAKSKVKVVHKKYIKKKHTKQQYHQKDSPFTLLVSQFFLQRYTEKKLDYIIKNSIKIIKICFVCSYITHMEHREAYKKIIIRDLSFLTWYIDWLGIDRTLNGKIFTFLSNFKFNPIAEHSRSAFSILYLAIQSIRIDPKNNTQRNEEENMKKMFVMCSAHNVLFIGGIFFGIFGSTDADLDIDVKPLNGWFCEI